MLLSLCNEVLRHLPLPQQCALAAKLGYGGLEVAPFTLAEDPTRLPAVDLAMIRRVVEDHGLVVTGLHWLLVAPAGLSITTDDAALRQRTTDVMCFMADACATLGGSVLVHGSPGQRALAHAATPKAARANAIKCLAAAGEAAAKAGVTYCLEPLSPRETDFINTVADAVTLVEEINLPGLRTMVDTSAAGLSESEPVAAVIRRWWPTGRLAHVQLNDTNRRAPGQGDNRFGPILAALKEVGYGGPVAVEPFVYEPDGPTTAAVAAGYLRGIQEGLA